MRGIRPARMIFALFTPRVAFTFEKGPKELRIIGSNEAVVRCSRDAPGLFEFEV